MEKDLQMKNLRGLQGSNMNLAESIEDNVLSNRFNRKSRDYTGIFDEELGEVFKFDWMKDHQTYRYNWKIFQQYDYNVEQDQACQNSTFDRIKAYENCILDPDVVNGISSEISSDSGKYRENFLEGPFLHERSCFFCAKINSAEKSRSQERSSVLHSSLSSK